MKKISKKLFSFRQKSPDKVQIEFLHVKISVWEKFCLILILKFKQLQIGVCFSALLFQKSRKKYIVHHRNDNLIASESPFYLNTCLISNFDIMTHLSIEVKEFFSDFLTTCITSSLLNRTTISEL